jgi:TadE-like protein
MQPRIAVPGQWPARRFLGTAGAAAVEFALVTPFLFLLIFGGVDFGNFFNSSQAIAAATRAGAEYARGSSTCKAGIQVLNTPQISTNCTTGIKNAMQNSFSFNPALTFPTSPALACYCDGDNGTITCGDFSCATAGRGNNEVFVSVSASQAITPLIPLPGFPATLNGLTELRLQ